MLEKGYPRYDLCECEVGRVVRRIQVWDEARRAAIAGAAVTIVKQSIVGAETLRGPSGVRETVPSLSRTSQDTFMSVEEISREAFEEMWAKGELVPANWEHGW
jgi:hypothetical protein